jgi:hypothetical protein
MYNKIKLLNDDQTYNLEEAEIKYYGEYTRFGLQSVETEINFSDSFGKSIRKICYENININKFPHNNVEDLRILSCAFSGLHVPELPRLASLHYISTEYHPGFFTCPSLQTLQTDIINIQNLPSLRTIVFHTPYPHQPLYNTNLFLSNLDSLKFITFNFSSTILLSILNLPIKIKNLTVIVNCSINSLSNKQHLFDETVKGLRP